MIRIPLSAQDAADRAQFLFLFIRTAIVGFPLLIVGEAFGYARGWYPGWVFGLLLLLTLPFLLLVTGALFGLIHSTAESFVRTVYGAGNLRPDPAHSGCESLVARGFYREAAEAFEAHLASHPADNLARVKLADLHRTHLGSPEVAERLYQEVRRTNPSPREEMLAANLLIELYRSTGQEGRLMVELARFAERYRGTRAGRDAARALREMKEARHRDPGPSGGEGGMET